MLGDQNLGKSGSDGGLGIEKVHTCMEILGYVCVYLCVDVPGEVLGVGKIKVKTRSSHRG